MDYSIEKLPQGISRIELDMPAIHQKAAFFNVRSNTYVIKSHNILTLFDCGSQYSIKLLEAALKPIGKISRIFLTHGHVDHAGSGSHWLKNRVEIYANLSDSEMLRSGGPSKATKLFRFPGFELTSSVKPDDSIEIGGYSFKVISAPGHTSGSVCYYDRQHDLIISGDLLCGPFWAWGYFASLNAQILTLSLQTKKALQVQLDTIEKLIGDGIIKETTLILPGHGAPFYLRGKLNNADFTKGFIRLFRSFKTDSG